MWRALIIGISIFALLEKCSSSIKTQNTVTRIKDSAASIPYFPLQKESDLDPLIKKIGNAHFVLLGEASHGTSEFQLWRGIISKRLIAEKGFRCVVLEADWNEMLAVSQFITGEKNEIDSAHKLLSTFQRWPGW